MRADDCKPCSLGLQLERKKRASESPRLEGPESFEVNFVDELRFASYQKILPLRPKLGYQMLMPVQTTLDSRVLVRSLYAMPFLFPQNFHQSKNEALYYRPQAAIMFAR